MKNEEIDILINECRNGSTDEARLIAHLRDSRLIVRTNAALALAKRKPINEQCVIDALLGLSVQAGGTRKVLGSINERMLAAYTLQLIGTAAALEASKSLRQSMTEYENADLDWHIVNNPL